MRFRDWMKMQETMTSTGCIAGFSRIALPLSRRMWPTDHSEEEKKEPKKKKLPPK